MTRACFLCVWISFIGTGPLFAADGSFVRDGVQLFYRTSGTGLPIVLLSGGPGFDADYMMAVADVIPGSYQRIIYEQRGTGRSRVASLTAETMTLRHAVDDLEALRVHLKQDRLTLIGHSWGGMLALAYASQYPNRVDRMIVVGSGGATLEHLAWFEDNITARLRPEDLEAVRYWGEAAKHGVDSDKVALEQVRAVTSGYFYDRATGLAFASQLPDGSVHDQTYSLLMADLLKTYDVRASLQRLDRPVLIIHGHQDPMGDKTAEDLHDLLKGSILKYVHKSGHFPWIEQPEEFRRIVTEFLQPPR